MASLSHAGHDCWAEKRKSHKVNDEFDIKRELREREKESSLLLRRRDKFCGMSETSSSRLSSSRVRAFRDAWEQWTKCRSGALAAARVCLDALRDIEKLRVSVCVVCLRVALTLTASLSLVFRSAHMRTSASTHASCVLSEWRPENVTSAISSLSANLMDLVRASLTCALLLRLSLMSRVFQREAYVRMKEEVREGGCEEDDVWRDGVVDAGRELLSVSRMATLVRALLGRHGHSSTLSAASTSSPCEVGCSSLPGQFRNLVRVASGPACMHLMCVSHIRYVWIFACGVVVCFV